MTTTGSSTGASAGTGGTPGVARVSRQGEVWVVEMDKPGGGVQRFECATEAMAANMRRMLDRSASHKQR